MLTNTNIFSIEELSYYLTQNVYLLSEELLGEELANWIGKEIGMISLAGKLLRLMREGNKVKEIVISILCSCDYYTRDEVETTIRTLEKIESFSPIQKQKIKADNCLRYHKYQSAIEQYNQLLQSKEANQLEKEEFGNIRHNLSIAYCFMRSFDLAADGFLEAYKKNRKEETLKEYIFALILGKKEDKIEEELTRHAITREMLEEWKKELKRYELEAEALPDYKELEQLEEIKQSGNLTKYYDKIDQMIWKWKKQYREGLC